MGAGVRETLDILLAEGAARATLDAPSHAVAAVVVEVAGTADWVQSVPFLVIASSLLLMLSQIGILEWKR